MKLLGRQRRVRRAPPGSAPGQLVVDPGAAASVVRALSYGVDDVIDHDGVAPADLGSLRAPGRVLWVDVTGLADSATLSAVAGAFGLHPLAVEDVADPEQRPKLDDYGALLVAVLKLALLTPGDLGQAALVLGDDFVVTFHDPPEDVFARVRDRVVRGSGRLRTAGADYLAYALIDAAVDSFFPVLEGYEELLEALEDEAVADGGPGLVAAIHAARSELLALRRAALPLHDLLTALGQEGRALVSKETRFFLRDVADHVTQIIETLEAEREAAKSLMDLHLSLVGYRTSEVTKVLTIIATIFIPLSFIAGVYGMNFNPVASPWNMPELNAFWGYPVALGLMTLLGLTMLTWFWRKGWLGVQRRR